MRLTTTALSYAAILLSSYSDYASAAPIASAAGPLVARTQLWNPVTSCENEKHFMLTFHEYAQLMAAVIHPQLANVFVSVTAAHP